MIQDFGDGLRLIGSGLVLLGTSAVGLALGIAVILALAFGVLACVPASLAWGGFQTLCSLRE